MVYHGIYSYHTICYLMVYPPSWSLSFCSPGLQAWGTLGLSGVSDVSGNMGSLVETAWEVLFRFSEVGYAF